MADLGSLLYLQSKVDMLSPPLNLRFLFLKSKQKHRITPMVHAIQYPTSDSGKYQMLPKKAQPYSGQLQNNLSPGQVSD